MPENPHAPEYIRQDASFFTDMSNDKDMLQFTNRKKSEDGMFYNAEGAGSSTAKLVETEEPREADHPLTLVEESNQDKYAAILALEKQARGGFLARPSGKKMGLAALLGLGAGGAGAAAGTAHSVGLAADEMAPETAQMDRVFDQNNTRMMDNLDRGLRSGDLATVNQAIERAPGLREASEAGIEGMVAARMNALRATLFPNL